MEKEGDEMTSLNDRMCEDIKKLNLDAPRVSQDVIKNLLSEVFYHFYRVPGSNTIVAFAVINGFMLCSEVTSCVSDENFNEELGKKYAMERCKQAAENKLWELEGWRLKADLEADRPYVAPYL